MTQALFALERRQSQLWWIHAVRKATQAHDYALPVVKFEETPFRPAILTTTHAAGKRNDFSVVLPNVFVRLEDVDHGLAVAL